MKGEISVGGKIYISASRAAEITSYSQDYIGQLCRAEKVPATMAGRSWFVDINSLVEYKKTAEKNARLNGYGTIGTAREKKAKLAALKSSSSSTSYSPKPELPGKPVWKFTYKEDPRPLTPILNKKGAASEPKISTVEDMDAVPSASIPSPFAVEPITFGPAKRMPSVLASLLLLAVSAVTFASIAYPDETRSLALQATEQAAQTLFSASDQLATVSSSALHINLNGTASVSDLPASPASGSHAAATTASPMSAPSLTWWQIGRAKVVAFLRAFLGIYADQTEYVTNRPPTYTYIYNQSKFGQASSTGTVIVYQPSSSSSGSSATGGTVIVPASNAVEVSALESSFASLDLRIANLEQTQALNKDYITSIVGQSISNAFRGLVMGGGGGGSNTTVISGGSGTVTSIDASGGATGLAFTGGPITNSGVLALSGTLNVTNGGTGTSTTPAYGKMLIGNDSGGYDMVATSSLGLTGTGGTVTSVDASGGTTGLTFSGGPINNSGTLTLSGTLGIANGGTGLAAAGASSTILTTNGSSDFWQKLATSQLTNDSGFIALTALSGTGPISYDNTTGAISCPTCNTTNATVSSVGTNNGLTGGTITTSGTIGLDLSGIPANNTLLTWNGSQLAATGTPNLTVGYLTATSTTATSTVAGGLAITGGGLKIGTLPSALLKTGASGEVLAALSGIDYATPGQIISSFPFTPVAGGNATSTLLYAYNGIYATGSSTIQYASTTALSVSGAATVGGTLTANNLNLTSALGIASGGTGLSSTGASSTILTTNGSSAFWQKLATSQLANDSGFITLLALSGVGPISYNNGTGAISCPTCDTFAYPFSLPGNATSTLTQFNGGITAYASSTIGNGAQAGGLTVNGGATTTGNVYIGGNVGIGTTTPASTLSVQGNGLFSGDLSVANLTATGTLTVLGLATSTFQSPLSFAYASTTATSTFAGINLPYGGCISVGGVCLTSSLGTVTSVAGNNGLSGTVTSSGNIGLDLSGITVNNAPLAWNGSKLTATGTQSFTAGYFIGTSTTASSLPNASTTNLSVASNLYGAGLINCTVGKITWANGQFGCGIDATGGGGTGGGSWSTTTSPISGELINYSVNSSDIVTIGGNSTTTAKYWFDPNVSVASLAGNVSVGATLSANTLSANTLSLTSALTIGNGGTGLNAIGASSTVLTTNGSSAAWQKLAFSQLTNDLGFTNYAFPFTPVAGGNATSTLLYLYNGVYALGSSTIQYASTTFLTASNGIAAYASSTIGNGTQGGGLTVNGGATTTGSGYIAGKLGIGTTTISATSSLMVSGNLSLAGPNSYLNFDINPQYQAGSAGYGLRENGGMIEFRNAYASTTALANNWTPLSSAASVRYQLNESGFINTGVTTPSALWGTITFVMGDYLYSVGGSDNIGTRVATIYRAPISSPTSLTNTGATLPGVISNSQAVVIGNYVYIFGGMNNSSQTNVIYRAPVSNPTAWVNTGAILPGSLAYSQALVIGDYVYLFGGTSNVIYRAPVSNPTAWVDTGATLPGAIYGSQAVVIGDYVYLFGGYSGGDSNVIYRAPVSNPTAWVDTGATLPVNLGHSQAVVIGDYVYLLGGESGGYSNIIYRAPVSNPTAWVNTGATLPGVLDASQAVVIGDYVYLFNGANGGTFNTIYRAPITSTANQNRNWMARPNAPTGPWFSTSPSSGSISFTGVGTSGGLVGIGTTSPASTLSIQGNGLFSGNLSVANLIATGTASVGGTLTANTLNLTNALGISYGGTGLTATGASSTVLTTNGSVAAWQQLATSQLTNDSGFITNSSVLSAFPFTPVAGGNATSTLLYLYNGLYATGSSTIAYASTTALTSSGSAYFATLGGNVGIGTTTPFGTLSINPTAGNLNPSFVIGSSSATSFIVKASGNVGIGTSTPWSVLSVQGTKKGGTTGIAADMALGVFGGTGGDNSASSVTSGTGGPILLQGGLGGSSTSAANSLAGRGGGINLIGGAGGNQTVGGTYRVGGPGGDIIIKAGLGGNVSGGSFQDISGPGGNIFIDAGGSGIATGGSNPPLNGGSGVISLASNFGQVSIGSGTNNSYLSVYASSTNLTPVETLYNTATSTVNAGAQLLFNATIQYNTNIADIAGIAGIVTDVSSAYKGALAFYTANGATPAEVGRFDYQGNLGIGTTSPASTLSIQGNGLFSGNLAVAGLTATGTALINTLNLTNALGISYGGTGLTATGASSTVFTTNGTTAAWQKLATSQLTNDLGFTNYVFPFTPVAGGNATSTLLYAYNGLYVTGSSTIQYASTTQLTSTGNAYLATTGGNVGIGTTSPVSALSVQGSGYVSSNLFVGGAITSTSSAASTFPYASTTALSVSGTASTTKLLVSGLGGGSTRCLQVNPDGTIAANTYACASPTGSGNISWSTTTSQVAGENVNYDNNYTDVVAIGSNSTTTAKFWFDPNVQVGYISGNLGIGTANPTAKLDVAGNINVSSGNAYNYNGTNIAMGVTALGDYFFGGAGNLSMSGSNNLGLGVNALRLTTSGGSNIALGTNAMAGNDSGTSNLSLGVQSLFNILNGNYNVALGENTLQNNSGGSNNTVVGYGSGLNSTGNGNVFLGYQTGQNLTSGGGNIVIGNNINTPAAGSANTLNIGNLIYGTAVDGSGSTMSSGNIGIGTTSPSQDLSVQGNGLFSGNLALAGLTATGTVTFSSLSSGLAAVGANGQLYSTATSTATNFAFPFTPVAGGNATSTLLYAYNGIYATGSSTIQYASTTFLTASNGIGAYASSTIGNGTQTGGLVISGGATTTGNSYLGGAVIANGNLSAWNIYTAALYDNSNTNYFIDPYGNGNGYSAILNGSVGIGTTTPAATLSIQGNGLLSGNLALANLTATGTITANTLNLVNDLSITNGGTGLSATGASSTVFTTNGSVAAWQKLATSQLTNDSGFITNSSVLSAFPFTPVAGGNATSTLLYLYNGVYALGSSTIQYASTTQLTSTGNAYLATAGGNVGIGTTSPASLLSLQSGNGQTGGIQLNTNANPGIYGNRFYPADSGNAGMLLRFQSSNSSNAWFNSIDIGHGQNANNPSLTTYYGTNLAVTSGNVGIGTTSPSSALSIQGNGLFSGNLSIANLIATGTISANTLNLVNDLTIANGGTGLSATGASSTVLTTNGSVAAWQKLATSQLTNDSGFITNSSVLSAFPFTPVAGGNATSTLLYLYNGLYATGSSTIQYASTTAITSSGSAYFATLGGNVGIGTTAPSSILDVKLAASDWSGGITLHDQGASTLKLVEIIRDPGVLGGMINLYNDSNAVSTKIRGSGVSYFNGGNVGIGTTTPWTKLSVQGASDLGNFALAGYFTATSTTATSTFAGGLNIENGSLTVDSTTGVTSIASANLGTMSFDTDAGIVSWVDLPLSAATAGTVESYTATLAGSPGITVYGTSTGSGTVNNVLVGIGTTTPASTLSVQGNSLFSGNLSLANLTATGTLTVTGMGASTFPYASTTMITATTASTTNLIVSGLGGTGTRCLQVGTDGTVSANASACGSGGSSFAFPFTPVAGGNATSTLLYAYNGLYATGSSTIQYASTTAITSSGSAYFATLGGNVGIGTTTPWTKLSVQGASDLGNFALAGYFTATSTTATSTFAGGLAVGTNHLVVDFTTGNVGIGTTTNSAILTVAVPTWSASTPMFEIASSSPTGAAIPALMVDNNGRVAIGTTTPSGRFEVGLQSGSETNAIVFSQIGYNSGLTASSPTPSPADFGVISGVGGSSGNGGLVIAGVTQTISNQATGLTLKGYIVGNKAGSTGVVISASGKNGSSPSALSAKNNLLQLQNSGTAEDTFTDSGALGIGTTTPNWALQVASTSPSIALTDTSGAPTDGQHWLISNNDGVFNIGTSSASLLSTSTYLTINGVGNVGIGTSTPASTLSIQGNGLFSGNLAIAGLTATGTALINTLNLTNDLTIANGGTGLSATGASSTVLTTNGSVAAWQKLATSQLTNDSGFLTATSTLTNNDTFSGTVSFTNAASTSFAGPVSFTYASSTATSTLAGINLPYGGCFAIGGTCIGTTKGIGTISTSTLETAGQIPVWSSTSGYPATLASYSNFTFTNGNNQLSIPSNGWYSIGGSLLAYASSTNQDTIFGIGAGGQNATTSATGQGNTAIGYQALNANTTGISNTAQGYAALFSNTTGAGNSAQGSQALYSNTVGVSNSAQGYIALYSNTTGGSNTAQGYAALFSNITGGSNTALGYKAGYSLTTGSSTIIIGNNVDATSSSATGELNIGNVLFGTGMYGGSTVSGTPVAGGMIGIGTTTPASTLSVQGNGLFSGNLAVANLTATGTLTLTGLTGTQCLRETNGVVSGTGSDCGSGGSSFGFPFTPVTGGNATSTLLYLYNGLYATGSSTIQYASTTAITSSGSAYFATLGGNVGIGTTTPWTQLSVQGASDLGNFALAGYFTATSTTATSTFAGGLNVGNGGLAYDFTTAVTSISALKTGPLNFDTNAGAVSWVDLPIDSTVAANTVEAYSASLNGAAMITVFGQVSSTAGTLMNTAVGIGSTTPYGFLSVAASTTYPGFVVSQNNSTNSGPVASFYASTTEVMRLTNGGKLGIGSTSPASTLTVTGSACFSGGAGASLNCGTAAGNIYYNTANTGGGTYDVAEKYIVSDQSIAPGDIIALDPANPLQIVKASGNMRPIGVISTAPGMILGGADAAMQGTSSRPVALSGRVPVNVSLEGGPIAIGDPITISSVPGVGRKANGSGDIVGLALETFAGASTTAQIEVFVNTRQYVDLSQFALASSASATSSSASTTPAAGAPGTDNTAIVFAGLQTLSDKVDALSQQIVSLASSSAATSTPATSTPATSPEELASSTAGILTGSASFIQSIADAVKSLIDSTGNWVVAQLTAKIVYADRIETQVAAVSRGIEMTDQVTGQIYCVTIKNGAFDRMLGSCGGTVGSTTPVVVTTPVATTPVTTTPVTQPVVSAPIAPISTSTPVTPVIEASTTPVSSPMIPSVPATTTTPAVTPPPVETPVTPVAPPVTSIAPTVPAPAPTDQTSAPADTTVTPTP